MSMVPSRYTVQVRRFVAGSTDAHGNAVDAWGTAADWRVRSIAPGSMEEPGRTNRDLSLVEYTIHADLTADVPDVRDLVLVDGVEYAVNGEPDDWTRGPWPNPAAGVAVELRRVEG